MNTHTYANLAMMIHFGEDYNFEPKRSGTYMSSVALWPPYLDI